MEDSTRVGKTALRRLMRDAWANVDTVGDGTATTARALELPEVQGARTVAAYAAMPGELAVDGLLRTLAERGVRVLLPRLLDDGSLQWAEHHAGGRLVPGRRGTTVPDVGDDGFRADLRLADVVVVPGLAFDPQGGRLGRGGGSYDRALAQAAPAATVIALAPDCAVVEQVPTEAHDRPVGVIVTPTKVIRAAISDC